MNGVRIRFLNKSEILPRLGAAARKILSSRDYVLEVSLFGSLVRGNYAPGSDADILILLRKDSRRFLDRIPEFLEEFSGVGIPVEVFPYTIQELKEMEDSSFLKTIQEEKEILASKGGEDFSAVRYGGNLADKRWGLRENEKRAIKILKEELVKRFGLIELRLFGSKARGEGGAESDIDVMIKVAEINPEVEALIDDIIFKINLENDSLISAIIFGKRELEEGPLSESPIYKVIQKEGVPI